MPHKKRSKKKTQVTYLAPPSSAGDDSVKALAVDYDPKTRVVDAFEQDLDFLLADAAAPSSVDVVQESLVQLKISESQKDATRAVNGQPHAVKLTKRIQKEILDFDIDFSDDEGDKDTGDFAISSTRSTEDPQIKTTKETQKTKSKSKPTQKSKKSQGKLPDEDPFKTSEAYFKQLMGLSDTDSDEKDSSGDELDADFKFEFVVSDEEEQIQLDEEQVPQQKRDKPKPSQKKSEKTRKAKKKPDDLKPLTRSGLLDNKKTNGVRAQQNPKSRSTTPDTTGIQSDTQSKPKKAKRKRPPRKAPTALKKQADAST
ncbi:CYFA0S12e00782g1_1 [Cyberlindnera fabianii]|uniref:CYFA0S12e00782g1_1 n=1 Tax=Cyberlindnera fabianii TaxID=36022 RepID=A0A061B0Z2_CYBFA|nr:CYFA0S12e00782g1_1 [Cyberlindnera fabianii]